MDVLVALVVFAIYQPHEIEEEHIITPHFNSGGSEMPSEEWKQEKPGPVCQSFVSCGSSESTQESNYELYNLHWEDWITSYGEGAIKNTEKAVPFCKKRIEGCWPKMTPSCLKMRFLLKSSLTFEWTTSSTEIYIGSTRKTELRRPILARVSWEMLQDLSQPSSILPKQPQTLQPCKERTWQKETEVWEVLLWSHCT